MRRSWVTGTCAVPGVVGSTTSMMLHDGAQAVPVVPWDGFPEVTYWGRDGMLITLVWCGPAATLPERVR